MNKLNLINNKKITTQNLKDLINQTKKLELWCNYTNAIYDYEFLYDVEYINTNLLLGIGDISDFIINKLMYSITHTEYLFINTYCCNLNKNLFKTMVKYENWTEIIITFREMVFDEIEFNNELDVFDNTDIIINKCVYNGYDCLEFVRPNKSIPNINFTNNKN